MKQTATEKTIVIDIRLSKRLVLALSCALAAVALYAFLTLVGGSAMASEVETAEVMSTGMRQYYMTDSLHAGNETLTACEEGYHLASMWEIADPTNLKYDTALGFSWGDSGEGPSSARRGWVRTGASPGTGATPGMANCEVWTSNSSSDYGSTALLDTVWTDDPDVGLWTVDIKACDGTWYVWCVED